MTKRFALQMIVGVATGVSLFAVATTLTGVFSPGQGLPQIAIAAAATVAVGAVFFLRPRR